MTRNLCLYLASALLSSFGLAVAPVSAGDDPVLVAPANYKVVFENELVRVLETTYGPDEKSVMHSHPRNMVIPLTDGVSRPVDSEGNITEYKFKAGDVIWREAIEHVGTNSSAQPMRLLTIEFKEPEDRQH